MDAKTRLILALLMSSVMVAMVTLLVTWLNLGFDAGFLGQWVRAYFIAWPVAALTGFVVMPPARRLTDRIVARLDARGVGGMAGPAPVPAPRDGR
jgi:hypothetical protein